MKLIINNNVEPTVSVQEVIDNLDTKLVIYKRQSWNHLEEYAVLKRLRGNKKGFVPLIGGNKYSPCLVADTWEETIKGSIQLGKVLYCFDSLEEFMKNKHLMRKF